MVGVAGFQPAISPGYNSEWSILSPAGIAMALAGRLPSPQGPAAPAPRPQSLFNRLSGAGSCFLRAREDLSSVQGAMDCRFADPVLLGELCHRGAGCVSLGDYLALANFERWRAAELLALLPGPRDAGLGSGEDQRPLELGNAAQDGQEQLAGRRGRITPRLSEAGEAAGGLFKLVDDIEQVAAGARQAVQARHHDRIPGAQCPHQPLELGAAIGRLAGALLGEDALAAGGLQCLNLLLMVLPTGADPGVTVPHRKTPCFWNGDFRDKNSLVTQRQA